MKLYSRKYGDKGKHLIIIHGLFGMSDNWLTLGKRFSKSFRVHLIDLRNHGRSPHSDKFNYDVMCEDLLKYMIDNNIKKSNFLGHSLGGKLAMKFAFNYPQLVIKFVVADIAPRKYKSDFFKKVLKNLVKIPVDQFNKRNDIEKILANTFKDRSMRLFLMKNLYRDQQNNFAWRFNIKILLEKVHNIEEADFVKGICRVPTHFIKGEMSSYISLKDQTIIKRHFLNSSFCIIYQAGHWLHAEKPEGFYNEVMRFLQADTL